ncbi:sigma-54-dependent Fis family transcriptional regulator [Aliikangiella marina]|uniref:Sigma-54-dependent Fis family transcriptional regulator n=1 Tax=Aliikangiella marina TaxID=1712262 RepID=A0A545T985_9GAMM|nr:sigma-54 dependent transcriptional regulator [Aliikangiella marina]TQV73780.1 sigma-54-dependent Fis family transcriptional regulator [Aliikangiella marina]
MKSVIYVVDDERAVLDAMKRCLRKIDAEFHFFESPIKAVESANDLPPNIVITDQRMPFMTGTEMLANLREKGFDFTAILVSAFNDFNDVAGAFNRGLIQKYAAKPWDQQEIRDVVNHALQEPKQAKIPAKASSSGFHGIISEHPSMAKTFEYIRKASGANIPVFVTGETGTGKELAARVFHLEGMRSSKPFIAVNCANFSETLMESQLFGHVKGAFTGAVSNQAGLLENAEDGVLFLDEITCLPLTLQAKLLRVLQEREFSPIGSHSVKKFLAQIVSASSTPLQEAVERGEFREDLYYRLNVISVGLPPLRERGEDILLLAKHFVKRFNAELGKHIDGFTPAAEEKLMQYHWPGNVRQLQNLLHGVVVLNEGPLIDANAINVDIQCDFEELEQRVAASIEPQDNQQNTTESASQVPHKSEIKPLWLSEKESIEAAINAFEGNIPRAAAALEVSPSTLYRKIQSWKKNKGS